jgi:hypothetical protein
MGVFIGTSILNWIFGTLMGWFTHRWLNNLCNQISQVQNQQHRLLKIQQATLARLDNLETILSELIIQMEKSEAVLVNYFALDHGHPQLHFHMQKLMRALQATNLQCV